MKTTYSVTCRTCFSQLKIITDEVYGWADHEKEASCTKCGNILMRVRCDSGLPEVITIQEYERRGVLEKIDLELKRNMNLSTSPQSIFRCCQNNQDKVGLILMFANQHFPNVISLKPYLHIEEFINLWLIDPLSVYTCLSMLSVPIPKMINSLRSSLEHFKTVIDIANTPKE